MQELTVEPALGEKLGQLAEYAVLCDSEGRVLGLFQPFRDRPKREEFNFEPPWSIEQSKVIRKHGGTGKPLDEILKRLGIE
jgi:hypothetical protein